MTLEETLQKIHPLDEKAMEISRKRWDSIAKPLHSLGKMEDLVVQIAGITGSPDMNLKKRALVAMCADNGVVAILLPARCAVSAEQMFIRWMLEWR